MYSIETVKAEVRRYHLDSKLHFQHANRCCYMSITRRNSILAEKTDHAKSLDKLLLVWVNGLFCRLLSYSDALRDLVPFVLFRTREKHPRRMLLLLNVTLLDGSFHVFLIVQMVPNCTNISYAETWSRNF